MSKKIFFLLFTTILVSNLSLEAQNSSSSPYSRFGIGDLQFSGFARNLGMDGISHGIGGNWNLNPSNPAAYSNLIWTTYEAGVNLQLNELSSGGLKQQSDNASLSYFAFGFPVISKKWGLGFGLVPYSNVGYSINDPRTDDRGNRELHTYDGSGGLNQFYLSSGLRLAKNLSFGLTGSYLFGVIAQDRTVEFDNSIYFNTRVENSTSIGWFNMNIGLQYSLDSLRLAPSDSLVQLEKMKNAESEAILVLKDSLHKADAVEAKSALEASIRMHEEEISRLNTLKKTVVGRKSKGDWNLTMGLILAPSAELRARNSTLAYSFKYFDNFSRDRVIIRDTIQNVEGERGDIRLPLNAGFGISMKKGNQWLAGADFSFQNWEDFSWFNTRDSLANSWKVSLGGQYTPNDRAIKSYWKLVQYRAGVHYAKSFLQLRSSQLEETGFSVGAGFPIRRAATVINLAIQAGQRGTVENNLIHEKYIRFTLGFTLNDRWFIKSKFD